MQRRATTRLASEMVLNHGANTNSNTTHAHDDDDDDDGDNPEPRGCLPNRGSKQKARRARATRATRGTRNPGNPATRATRQPGAATRQSATRATTLVRRRRHVAPRRRTGRIPSTASNRFEPIAPFEPDKSDAFAAVVLFLLLLGVVACAVAFPYQGVLDSTRTEGRSSGRSFGGSPRGRRSRRRRGEALAPFPDAEAAAPLSGIEAFLAPARNA